MHLPLAASRRCTAAAVLVAAGLALAACGDDDDAPETSGTATAPTAVDTAEPAAAPTTTVGTTGTAPNGTGGASDATEEEYVATGAAALDLGDPEVDRCITQAMIDAIGFENVQATGLSPDELFAQDLSTSGLSIPDDRQQTLQDAVAGCGDLIQLFAESEDASESEIACGREHLTNDLMAEVFVNTLTASEPSAELQEASDAMDACVTEG